MTAHENAPPATPTGRGSDIDATRMISIRPAVPEDVETLRSLDLVAHSDSERQKLITVSVRAGTCCVAVSRSELVGYGVLTYTFYGHGWIDLLYVAAGRRRQGVGRALLEYMEGQCRTAKLFTSTNLSNLPMQGLLAKLGYTVSGVIDNLDEADPEIVYFKRRS